MPQVTDKPLIRICTRLFAEDLEYLTRMAEATEAGISRDMILRNIVHNYVMQIKSRERARLDSIPPAVNAA